VSSISDLRPGMIGFGPITGPAAWPVWAGQLILGEGFTVGELKIEHVFVVTEAEVPGEYGVGLVEAMPNGARHVQAGNRWTPEYAYVQLSEDYPGQSTDAAAIARAMVGTPYSFASYAALAAWRFGWKTPKLEAWIDRRRMVSSGALAHKDQTVLDLPAEAICSVLADQAWALTGKQVMPAGTPHQCVTPGALARALLQTEGAKWIWPGR
jgi:hypothetical protein